MIKPFVCGTGSFQQDDIDDERWVSTSKSLKKTRSFNKQRRNNTKKNTNPYSNPGLDTFALVLADLDERRQKIYEKTSLQDISMIRFGYSSSRGWIPIVVKLNDQGIKDKPKQIINDVDTSGSVATVRALTQITEEEQKENILEEKSIVETRPPVEQAKNILEEKSRVNIPETKKGILWSNVINLVKWKGPSNYLLTIFLIILFCVVIHGRSLAIVCTSVCWYFVPRPKPGDFNAIRRKPMMKKKKYGRSLTEKKMKDDGPSSPKCKKHKPKHHGNKSS